MNEKTDVALAWVNCQFINHKNQLRQGLASFKLWPGEGSFIGIFLPTTYSCFNIYVNFLQIGTCVENVTQQYAKTPVLYVEFLSYGHTVYFPPYLPSLVIGTFLTFSLFPLSNMLILFSEKKEFAPRKSTVRSDAIRSRLEAITKIGILLLQSNNFLFRNLPFPPPLSLFFLPIRSFAPSIGGGPTVALGLQRDSESNASPPAEVPSIRQMGRTRCRRRSLQTIGTLAAHCSF